MKIFDDVWKHIELVTPVVGWKFGLEALISLSKVFMNGQIRRPVPTKYLLDNGARFYIFDTALCKKIASAENESLLDLAEPWSQENPWKDMEVNLMDVVGHILEVAALCKKNKRSDFFIYFAW